MPQWFYQDGDQSVGPLKPSDLLRLVREQTISADTLVRKDESAWFPAREVGGLFQAAVKPTVSFSCPECGSEVPKPPCYCRRCRRPLQYARPRFTENEIEGYERQDSEKPSMSDSWKQWVRRLKHQRDERFGSNDRSL